MSKLHEALSSLSPIEWDDIPKDDNLASYLRNAFSQAELVVNSIPPPPGGSDFLSSTRTLSSPVANAATKASEIVHSEARPAPPAPEHAEFQKAWGKPVKVNAKDNPLGITLYKMAGHDRHGAWFARRSVHEGLGFTKWKKAMQREFPESLAVSGGPGEGSVRGIGADRRLEKEVVDGVGKLEVFQLSAQFPGPVAPREFITCLLTTDTGLTEKSAPHGECPAESKVIPRHWMVVSVPIDHPDAPPRQGLVRGTYESVEMIREIRLPPSKSKSTPNLLNTSNDVDRGRPRGSTIGFAESRGESAKGERLDKHELAGDDPETNPVEWIMVTRSDPGGGIPRFMVERGTPASITGDAVKFLDWATAIDEPTSEEEQEQEAQVNRKSSEYHVAEGNGHLAGINTQGKRSQSTFEPSGAESTGVIASLTNAALSGLEAYAPTVVQNNLPTFMHPDHHYHSDTSSSTDSFESFDNTADFRTAYEGPRSPDPLASSSSLSLFPDDSSGKLTETGTASEQQRYEKELSKLEGKRKALDDRMDKVREQERQRTMELTQKEEKEVEKQKEKIEREKKKQEDRYSKELHKLEQKKEKEARRLEERRKKARDKDILSKTTRERDEYRRQLELSRRENDLLRQQMGELQRENTLLVQKVGSTGMGVEVLKAVREETSGRGRASSVGSRASKKSGETMGSSKLKEELVGGQEV